jgi:serine phosphatase RsbU (regulator of sigma subunit)
MSVHRPPTPLLVLGLAAFAVAALSVVDMYLPRPYDGVVLESGTGRPPVVQSVVPGSGAEHAGIASGDAIIGVGNSILTTKANAAQILNEREIGERVPYLVRRPVAGGYEQWEVMVELGRRQIGDTSYLYAILLGFSFFFIGLFVLLHQPRLRAGHVFFLLCSLFLLFLVCRLRPASYSWVDTVVLRTGTLALVLLPASFLHFFLIFPRPVWDGRLGAALGALRRKRVWTAALAVVYLVPVAVLFAGVWLPAALDREVHLINGAPMASWWVLAAYVLVALALLTANWARLPASGERRGAALVLAGSLVGMLPFLVLAVGFPSFLHTEQFVFYGVVPMVAIPLTFAYAIFRFQLLNVRVILRKSLLYTATTAVVTVVYALAIASFNAIFRGTRLADTAYFPLLFALAIVLLFEPLRRRIQGPMDRFFFAERTRLQRALVEMGEAFTGTGDPAAVVGDLVGRLPELLRVRFSALYLHRGEGRYERAAASHGTLEAEEAAALPAELELPPALETELVRRGGLARLDDLNLLRLKTAAVDRLAGRLAEAGVEVLGVLASSRRRLGLLVLAGKAGNVVLEPEELELLRGLCHQAAIALETSRLLDDRARQAELERDLEIASGIQRSLLPRGLQLGPGWRVASACRPARHVGGDFYAMLPGPRPDSHALVYGDVAGKSIPGALMMMAASEVLHSLALTHRDPEELFRLANRRLYEIGGRSFVAVGYFAPGGNGDGCLSYLLAGQPSPLKRCAAGGIEELPFPEHRLPLGALDRGGFRSLNAYLAPGDLVLAYSDGVVEAQSPDGELFGQERLEAVLVAAPGEPQQVIDHVLAELDVFTAGLDPYDDVTLLALARAAAGDDGSPSERDLP